MTNEPDNGDDDDDDPEFDRDGDDLIDRSRHWFCLMRYECGDHPVTMLTLLGGIMTEYLQSINDTLGAIEHLRDLLDLLERAELHHTQNPYPIKRDPDKNAG
jgi:hypothetical protein